MKEKIKENRNNAGELERLYQNDRKAFEEGFKELLPEIEDSPLSEFWKARLAHEKKQGGHVKTSAADVAVVLAACLMAALLIKLPDFFRVSLASFEFEARNAGLIIALTLAVYLSWHNREKNTVKIVLTGLALAILALYANLLPIPSGTDQVTLAFIHLPVLLWFLTGLVYISFKTHDKAARVDFIRYNGDLAIMLAVLLISGGILTALTIGLFQAIGFSIENFYADNIVKAGLVSVPVLATFILFTYPAITSRIAPVIAAIFSPLVLLTAVAYLVALAVSGKDPYNDRNFLLMFNVMLLGVMAVIVFTASGTSAVKKQKFSEIVLLLLSAITLLIVLVALSAIIYRLGAWGITPNRLAVLGSDALILGNLVLIIKDLYKVNFRGEPLGTVNMTVASYLPVYGVWALFVVFGFPLIFGLN